MPKYTKSSGGLAKANAARKKPEYSQEWSDRICGLIASSSKSIPCMCREQRLLDPKFPTPDTIFLWKMHHPDFSEAYELAKQHQVSAHIEETIALADDVTGDISRNRLQIDTRKWVADRLQTYKMREEMKSAASPEALRALADQVEKYQRDY